MEKKMFPKRTKVLFLIFGIVAVIAVIFGVWNSWRLKSSAYGWPPGLPGGHTSGMLIAQAKDASNGDALLDGVSVSGEGYQCTTGANGTGRCYLGKVNIGNVSATFSKTGYQSKTVSRDCGFGMATTCTIQASLSKDSGPPVTGTGTVSGAVFINGGFFKTPSCYNNTACKLEINFTPAAPEGNPYNAIVNNVGYYIKSYSPLAYVTLPAGHYTISSAKLIWTVGNSQTTYSNGKATPGAFDVKAGGRTDVRLDFTK